MPEIALEERKVHLISLGCARNRVDAEVMLGSMLGKGFRITDEGPEADVVVVNTCGFIGPAKEESIDTILEAATWKANRPGQKLVVTGCLTQRYKQQLAQGLPEVDLFIGTDEFNKITDYLDQSLPAGTIKARRTHYLYEGELPKLNTLTKGSAYVKVAEGCQHNCAFCIIPAIRGKLRSRPISSVVNEVQKLASEGVQEINLIAQDLAAYGRDHGEDRLLELLQALVKIQGIRWLRLLYVYPENISDEFLNFFANEPKIVKYLDIPMQHGHDDVLKRMNRGVTRRELEETVARVRQRVPQVAIRTSVMVGFPGESPEEFAALADFVQKMRFTHLGCFAYSQEEGTVAGRMKNQIDEETKQERLEAIMEIQQGISRENMRSLVGQTLDVLLEGVSKETDLLWQGRCSLQAPEVDGLVYINEGEELKPGLMVRAQIIEAHDYDLVARVLH